MSTTVLIIDDDPVLLRLMTFLFDQDAYEIETVTTVTEALKLVERKRPDVICCDLMMPEVSGLEFLAMCQTTPALTGIPVIIISGSGEQRMFDKARQLGAAHCLSKPFGHEQLIQVVESALAATPA